MPSRSKSANAMKSANEVWKPTASIETLKKRAQILACIRRFFEERGVMEVETQALSQYTVTDPFLVPFDCRFVGPDAAGGQTLYLQTSPEYAMKRLLAAGSGCIYQIAKAFRNEEVGRYHNPEFTMLEWYRVGFDDNALMNEIDALMQRTLSVEYCEKRSYQDAFQEFVGLDPLLATYEVLSEKLIALNMQNLLAGNLSRDDMLQLLFSEYVEPKIGQVVPCFIYDFPASQASLARINQVDSRVAHRFELYFRGVELANGFYELTDSEEQLNRFKQDNVKREALGIDTREVDERFIEALVAGLPECSGVALGVDRLIMLALDAESITEVQAFPVHIA